MLEATPGAAWRNAVVDAIEKNGRREWKRASGYHRRSLVENLIHRSFYSFFPVSGLSPLFFSVCLASTRGPISGIGADLRGGGWSWRLLEGPSPETGRDEHGCIRFFRVCEALACAAHDLLVPEL
ncbi:hypothetical protein CJO78_21405 (plasmid) [Ralstonia solanacearum]|nr:hypothetical protein CJO78_21405 [Ralstonia solanacearum]AXW08324.1 hypothetical protein CJO82_21075 [Ralstonia solanacearum]AXW26114.1 hypothetical protein CJO86_21340 [Ralstonia solanacearum]AXW64232.1 hypothetical protein CJO94_21255 [Ralstonia solanacearum]AXW83023.1 hypothetical protein CJO98_21435 [Ralstonia solanacearum]